MPNFDTRSIRRIEGAFTVDSEVDLGRAKHLCDYCGCVSCHWRDDILEVSESGPLYVTTRLCGEFVPILTFSVSDGLHYKRWNTIRIGGAWYRRLRKKDLVLVYDKNKDERVSYFTVSALRVGPLEDILKECAIHNHAIRALGIKDKDEAAEKLHRILKNAYGTNIAAAAREATAIYLSR